MGGRGHSAHRAHYIEAFNGMGRWFPNPPDINPGHFPTLLDPTDRKMPRFYVRGVGVLAFSKPPVLPGGLVYVLYRLPGLRSIRMLPT